MTISQLIHDSIVNDNSFVKTHEHKIFVSIFHDYESVRWVFQPCCKP